jgi:hypothetical protein
MGPEDVKDIGERFAAHDQAGGRWLCLDGPVERTEAAAVILDDELKIGQLAQPAVVRSTIWREFSISV